MSQQYRSHPAVPGAQRLLRAFAPVSAALLVAMLAGCAGASPPAAPVTVTVEVPVPAPPPAAPSTAPAPAAAAPQSWTMPNLVGAGLQEAQNAVQRLTGYAIPITTSHDATGADRMQVADRNWKVCSQNVAPGTTITPGTTIDFGAAKLDEDC